MGYIGKVNIGGTQHLVASTLYGTCSTAADVDEKEVILADFNELITGVTIHVKFENSNAHVTPTLKVGSTTAKQIRRYGTTKPGTNAYTSWNAGAVVSFTYDGTYWIMNNWLNEGVTQTNTSTTNSNYRILFSRNANNTTEVAAVRKSGNLLFNPSSKTLTLGSAGNQGNLVLYSADQSSPGSYGTIIQPLHMHTNINHYLPTNTPNSYLLNQESLINGDGISIITNTQGNVSCEINAKSYKLCSFKIDSSDFSNFKEDDYLRQCTHAIIYYSDASNKNRGSLILSLDSLIFPQAVSQPTEGSEFTLSIVGDINTTYLRTLTCRFVTTTGDNWKLKFESSYTFTPSAQTGSGITWSCTPKSSYANSSIIITEIQGWIL